MRILALVFGWTGYLEAQYRAMIDQGADIFVVTPGSMTDTSFAPPSAMGLAGFETWEVQPDSARLTTIAADFAPEVCLMGPWNYGPYRDFVRTLPEDVLRVVQLDNLWYGSPRQWAGRLVSPWYVRSRFDAALVASDRTEQFAQKFGFGPESVIRGSLTADTAVFASEARSGQDLATRRTFISSMRLVAHKGADVLAEAYRRYRQEVEDPWDLTVVGTGPLRERFEGSRGVHLAGFVAPSELRNLMAVSSCYVNPSRADPYGVAIHEAAAMALPLIATTLVGAGPVFLQDGTNGVLTLPGSVTSLSEALARVSGTSADELGDWSRISRNLSTRLSPESSARHILAEYRRRRERLAEVGWRR